MNNEFIPFQIRPFRQATETKQKWSVDWATKVKIINGYLTHSVLLVHLVEWDNASSLCFHSSPMQCKMIFTAQPCRHQIPPLVSRAAWGEQRNEKSGWGMKGVNVAHERNGNASWESETNINITSELWITLPKQVVIFIDNKKCIKSLSRMCSSVY